MTVEVPDTDISFDVRSFTGRELKELTKIQLSKTPDIAVIESTLQMVCAAIYKDGKPVKGSLDLLYQEELVPLYFAAAKESRPKVPSGLTTEKS